MEGKIFLVGSDNELLPMKQETYASEQDIQDLLEEYPALLAGDQIDPDSPRTWLHVSREKGVASSEGGGGRWSLDHLFLDQSGIPTLVEVKRSTDTRIRREVVGQLLEYASHAMTYWDPESIRRSFESACEENAENPEEKVFALLGETKEPDYDEFWDRVAANLSSGQLRLLFVADVIPRELRRIVEFLNEQMDPAEILAVEVRQFVGMDRKALVPTVLGLTSKGESKVRRRQSTMKWDEAGFFEDMYDRHGEIASRTARRLLDWISPKVSRVWWGTARSYGSFVPVIEKEGISYQILRCDTWRPGVQVYFAIFKDRGLMDLEDRKRLKERLEQIDGVAIGNVAKYPSFNLETLYTDEGFKAFTRIYDEIIEKIHQKHS